MGGCAQQQHEHPKTDKEAFEQGSKMIGRCLEKVLYD